MGDIWKDMGGILGIDKIGKWFIQFVHALRHMGGDIGFALDCVLPDGSPSNASRKTRSLCIVGDCCVCIPLCSEAVFV